MASGTPFCVLLVSCSLTFLSSSPGVRGRTLDLTHAYNNDTWAWPIFQYGFIMERVFKGFSENGIWFEANLLHAPEHGGTHMDAPRHFAKDAWSVDEIPLDRLIAPVIMVDISARAAQDPDANVTVDDVTDWESAHGRIPAGAVVFQCSGWSARYGVDKAGYFGNDSEDTAAFHFPGFSVEAATWLADERGVVGVAVDTPSTDNGASTRFPTHVELASRNVYGLENVKDPCSLPPSGATAYVMPMKIEGGSGAPARIVVTWDDEPTNGAQGSYSPRAAVVIFFQCLIVGVLLAL